MRKLNATTEICADAIAQSWLNRILHTMTPRWIRSENTAMDTCTCITVICITVAGNKDLIISVWWFPSWSTILNLFLYFISFLMNGWYCWMDSIVDLYVIVSTLGKFWMTHGYVAGNEILKDLILVAIINFIFIKIFQLGNLLVKSNPQFLWFRCCIASSAFIALCKCIIHAMRFLTLRLA